MAKIKILHLIAPTTVGGAERTILLLMQHINARHFDPMVCSFIYIKRQHNLFVNALNMHKHKNLTIYMNSTFDFRNIFDIIKIIKKNGIDILHTHGYRSDIIGLLCSKLSGKLIVSTVHGWTSSTRRLRLYQVLDRIALRFFDQIIAVSSSVRETLLSAHVPESKLQLITNAVPSILNDYRTVFPLRQSLNIPKNAKIICTVARLSKEKGVDYLIRSFYHVNKHLTNAFLLIVGEGREASSLRMLAQELRLHDRVIFLGFQPEVGRIYSEIDLFVLSSLTEGTPMALLEAMSHGVPVVASSVGEVPKIIEDGANGVLVRPADHKLLASKILSLLSDPTKANQMGKTAKHTISINYNLNSWITKMEHLYTALAKYNHANSLSLKRSQQQ